MTTATGRYPHAGRLSGGRLRGPRARAADGRACLPRLRRERPHRRGDSAHAVAPVRGRVRSAGAGGYLADAVRAFFENAGELCYVLRLDPAADDVAGLKAGLAALGPADAVDLVCAPDVMRPRVGDAVPPDPAAAAELMQTAVLDHCADLGDRFAILDARPATDVAGVLEQRSGWDSTGGALYFPWVRTPDPAQPAGRFVPPCGHVAGLYAQIDQQSGVHQAPANRVLRFAVDLEAGVSAHEQAVLNPRGVNCLRALPGRGIRVWGARTLSLRPEWTYVNVRRLFLTVGRWLERNLAEVAFEPNESRLWVAHHARADRLPRRPVPARRAGREDEHGGLLRQVRRRDQPARGRRARDGGDPGRGGPHRARRVRRRPHHPRRQRRQHPASSRTEQERSDHGRPARSLCRLQLRRRTGRHHQGRLPGVLGPGEQPERRSSTAKAPTRT